MAIQAIYENGVFRLTSPIPGLQEGETVRLTIIRDRLAEVEAPPMTEEQFERDMEAIGMRERNLISPKPAPKDFRPIAIEGEPQSETIIRNRR